MHAVYVTWVQTLIWDIYTSSQVGVYRRTYPNLVLLPGKYLAIESMNLLCEATGVKCGIA